MGRHRTTTPLAFLLAAFVAFSGFGPRAMYAHSHPSHENAHHTHANHETDSRHDHDRPALSDAFAHRHGTWLGIPVTLPAENGDSGSTTVLDDGTCPTLVSSPDTVFKGPQKERIPWAWDLIPKGMGVTLVAPPFINAHFDLDGPRTPYAIHCRTVVLRC